MRVVFPVCDFRHEVRENFVLMLHVLVKFELSVPTPRQFAELWLARSHVWICVQVAALERCYTPSSGHMQGCLSQDQRQPWHRNCGVSLPGWGEGAEGSEEGCCRASY